MEVIRGGLRLRLCESGWFCWCGLLLGCCVRPIGERERRRREGLWFLAEAGFRGCNRLWWMVVVRWWVEDEEKKLLFFFLYFLFFSFPLQQREWRVFYYFFFSFFNIIFCYSRKKRVFFSFIFLIIIQFISKFWLDNKMYMDCELRPLINLNQRFRLNQRSTPRNTHYLNKLKCI